METEKGGCPHIAPQELWLILLITPPDTSGQLETPVFRGISVYSDIHYEWMWNPSRMGCLKWQSFSMNHHFRTSPFGWPSVYSVAKQRAAWALEWAYLAFGESEKDRKRNGKNSFSHTFTLSGNNFLPCV